MLFQVRCTTFKAFRHAEIKACLLCLCKDIVWRWYLNLVFPVHLLIAGGINIQLLPQLQWHALVVIQNPIGFAPTGEVALTGFSLGPQMSLLIWSPFTICCWKHNVNGLADSDGMSGYRCSFEISTRDWPGLSMSANDETCRKSHGKCESS